MNSKKTILGLMSGTSLDGVDVALLKTDGETVLEAGAGHFVPFDDALQSKLRGFMDELRKVNGQTSGFQEEFLSITNELTKLYGDAIDAFLNRYETSVDDIDAIGLHGQTVFHDPSNKTTIQLGDGQALADRFAIQTVYDFRANDVAQGGQGAPLVPIFMKAIADKAFHERAVERNPLVFLNLGGVANITYVDPNKQDELIAFDTGPGNGLINDWMVKHANLAMDKGGALAAKGAIQEGVVNAYCDLDYVSKPYPKSLDRLDFDLKPAADLSLEDGAATLTDVTAKTILLGIQRLPSRPLSCYVSGGGRYNKTLLKRIEAHSKMSVHPIDLLGWSPDDLEAQAFAYLAARRLANKPISFPLTTGAPKPLMGGVVAMPKKLGLPR